MVRLTDHPDIDVYHGHKTTTQQLLCFLSESFEVTVNGQLIFSKLKLYGFPKPEDVSLLQRTVVITTMFVTKDFAVKLNLLLYRNLLWYE